MGAVVGGGTRYIMPHGGKNESRSDTRGAAAQTGGARVGEVQAGQADPAQAAALQSTAQPTPREAQPPIPRTGPMEYPDHPFPTAPVTWPGMGDDAGSRQPYPTPPPPPEPPAPPAQQPPAPPVETARQGPIPPRPAPRPAQAELPLERPDQPQRQMELPLQPPATQPQAPVPEQGSLDLTQPRQPVVQQGLPGMGADVTHEPGAQPVHSAEGVIPPIEEELRYDQQGRLRKMLKRQPEPSTAEPEADTTTEQPAAKPAKPAKAAKAAATKDSDEAPAAAPLKGAAKLDSKKAQSKTKTASATTYREGELPPDTAKWLASADEDEAPAAKGDTTAARAATMADREKAAGQAAVNAAVARGAPSIPRGEQPAQARAKSGKPLGTFDTSKLGEKTGSAKTAEPVKAKTGPEIIESKKPQAKGTFDTSKLGAKAEAPAQMPFMITQLMKAQLRALGYKSEAISNMTPADAHTILQGKTPPKPVQTERPTVAAKDGEPKVTVVPPTDARLGGTKVSDAARKAGEEAKAVIERKKKRQQIN